MIECGEPTSNRFGYGNLFLLRWKRYQRGLDILLIHLEDTGGSPRFRLNLSPNHL